MAISRRIWKMLLKYSPVNFTVRGYLQSTAFLQGLPPASNGVPASAATSCDVVSYVTSTVNPKYRQSRDCQLRMKTLRLREEKDSNAELVAPLKKKKKSRGDENTAFDKVCSFAV